MSQFATRFSNSGWLWPITFMLLITGWLLGGALNSTTQIREQGLWSGRQQDFSVIAIKKQEEQIKSLNEEIGNLRKEKTKLIDSMSNNSGEFVALKTSHEDLLLKSGMTNIIGDGVEILLRDSNKRPTFNFGEQPPNLIHDSDVIRVVNELFAAGAEAIAINGHRYISTSSIRCVGPVIQVNSVPVSSPIIVEAIGDPETLYSGLRMTGGVLSQIEEYDPSMAQIRKMTNIKMKAYEGAQQSKFMRKDESK